MATYFGVPGFKYEIRTLFEVEEALKMIGMGYLFINEMLFT